MHDKYNETHKQLALAIKGAKKAMFKKHRAGVDLQDAGDDFVQEMCGVLNDLNREPAAAAANEPDRAEVANVSAERDEYLDCVERCEELAAAAVQGFDERQELALVSLLEEISSRADARDLARSALYAAFKASSGLHDQAIRLIIEAAEGGDA